ncbi:MAG: UDP-N-acetylmuramoyl-tripeptide--D-alanyl-D-alanine ligase [Peptostreptococcus porci]|uniref:UDP-N-acetylmuramoyl-tripeptide--D-alanyl-D-alanine ligase n=1 Tax=Peptostreptococcus porci TaxID=2652282 RepID=A0A6N7WYD2_9FIRM|nr:UDP-N-acetylmuramoyl-tripeptide--D-alanyl-D-alanine ligase [Peptostreptococcus porci]MDY5479521.1 UDP-N-acetylmuramoyl-tripeptide--D-alanyl-D-alanine ligase [Peptostreptococcus porci]MST61875.1 UDP-N-acetylmuramoyl-tripeptide--D-alanyl-D-alanine ligase [Peptostreptococcus porci]
MKSLTVAEIVDSTAGNLMSQCEVDTLDNIVIDSRDAGEKSMFVAIIGETLDGHCFVEPAHENGCRTFLISSAKNLPEKVLKDSNIILVENTELALGKISKYYLSKFDVKVIGITGSVGKTTTRDFVYSVVSNKYCSIKNEKNFNNQFGVPLTIFNINNKHEVAVIEMGMCGFGEIDYLAEITRPQIAVISNIGLSHIQSLGSQEGIFKAKMEISNYFDEGSVLIVNGDDEFLSNVYRDSKLDKNKYKFEVQSFGKLPTNTIYLKEYKVLENKATTFIVKIEGIKEDLEFTIPTIGEHNLYNALSAILVGIKMGMSVDEIREGFKNFIPTKDRQDILSTDNFTIINDVYNASPDSMIASLRVLSMYDDKRRVAILGDCLEMGDFAELGHRKIGFAAIGKADIVITVGDKSQFIGIEAKEKGFDLSNVYHFESKLELFEELRTILEKDDVILVKASRGMKFEEIVEYLKEGIDD